MNDLDRARFGQNRESWGHEYTRDKTHADLSLSATQRMRRGHDWVGVDKEAVVHDPDTGLTRVTVTHWKDARIDHDTTRAATLRDNAHALSDQWSASKKECLALEDARGEVYGELCSEKYLNSDLQTRCIHVEQQTRDERKRTKRAENQRTGLAKLRKEEQERTQEMREYADYLERHRAEKLRLRETTLGCCGTCCTACCWEDKLRCCFFWRFTWAYWVGPCKCQGDTCCEKDWVLGTLSVRSVLDGWEKRQQAKKEAFLEKLRAQRELLEGRGS